MVNLKKEIDRKELIGQIIDIFEDNLGLRNRGRFFDNDTECKIVPVYKEDKDCSGVFYGGGFYDEVAAKIEDTLVKWGLIPKCLNLYLVQYEEKWCVSTSKDECYCDEEIYNYLGISEEKFYEISRRFNPSYYYHTFDYGFDEKEVCDTSFSTYNLAGEFMDALLKEANK